MPFVLPKDILVCTWSVNQAALNPTVLLVYASVLIKKAGTTKVLCTYPDFCR